ncbi:uncharacterized protein [Onthophagus taurus]|uniref:uncharacterized protein n=1 Tax=Onthophagus taurus TaxID=166361 RepID=UPI000C206916|nr:uncharacterized protein LOC111426828 [Onthophagus taurus]
MEFPKLWESDKEYKPLRHPSSNDKNHLTDSSMSSDGDYCNSSKTPLRAEAKEWFPRGYTPQQQTPHVASGHSIDDRLKKIRLGEPPSEPDPAFDQSHLESILQSLTYDPGQFDNLLETLMDLLEPHFSDVNISQVAADMVFQYAVMEASFRYNAARICCIVDEQSPIFRSHLHILCEKELQTNTNGQGLTLFLAELYMQLNYESIHERFLILSIENLLKMGQEEDLKCVCKALKLTGYSLEENYSQTLDGIFAKLEQLKPTFSQSLNNIVESTVNLRKNHWGRNTNSNSTQEQNGETPVTLDVDSICYGPDGQEITTEEHEFLCANIDDYLADESSDPDDLFDPEPEMDAEIQEAFREFVKMGKR